MTRRRAATLAAVAADRGLRRAIGVRIAAERRPRAAAPEAARIAAVARELARSTPRAARP
jgi:hypothetical protein